MNFWKKKDKDDDVIPRLPRQRLIHFTLYCKYSSKHPQKIIPRTCTFDETNAF